MDKQQAEFLEQPIKELKEEIQDWKKFAFKGRMLELSVAFIIGAAFKSVVTGISDNLVMPIINYVLTYTGNDWRETVWHPLEGLTLEVGKFAGTFIDFLLISIILFIVYQKMINNLLTKEPDIICITTKECPECFSKIDYRCTRCPHCTVEIKL